MINLGEVARLNRDYNEEKRKIARKNFYKKKRKRKQIIKRFLKFAFLLISFMAIIISLVFLINKFWIVDRIIIEGENPYSEAEILDKGDIKKGESWLFFDTKGKEKLIYKTFNYVDEVKVSRKLPNDIKISIKAGEKDLYLEKDDKFYVASKRDKLIEIIDELPIETYGVSGVEFKISDEGRIIYDNESNIRKNNAKKIKDIIREKGLNNIKNINLSDEKYIYVNYDDRIKVNLGDAKDLEYKIETTKEIILNKIGNEDKGELDISNLMTENRSYFKK